MKGPDRYGFSFYRRRLAALHRTPLIPDADRTSAPHDNDPNDSDPNDNDPNDSDPIAARVLGDYGSELAIAAPCGPLRALLPPDLRSANGPGVGRPGVGDWIRIDRDGPAGSGPVRVLERLPRTSELVRRASGELGGQLLAANVELALIVTALTFERNPRRLERTVSLVRAGGAEAVVLLNKADLSSDAETIRAELAQELVGVPIHAISAHTGRGLEAIEERLQCGVTAVLLGSSGVGKSTLTNRLLGADERRVQAERASDSRGRHTTTTRTLLRLPGGALLIDTPGLREVGLWGSDGESSRALAEAVDAAFPEIAELAVDCRFRDCRHEAEPGCAVLAAIEDGRLPDDRVRARGKLGRELIRTGRMARRSRKARQDRGQGDQRRQERRRQRRQGRRACRDSEGRGRSGSL